MEVPCSRVRGRPRKTWSDCVKADMNVCSLDGIDQQDRTARKSGIRRISRLLPTPTTGTPAADEKLNQDQVKSSQALDTEIMSVKRNNRGRATVKKE